MRGDIVTTAELQSVSGKERLRLIYVELENDGLDFHSLALETFENEAWVPNLVIEEAQFQGQNKHRRWIANLHSRAGSARLNTRRPEISGLAAV